MFTKTVIEKYFIAEKQESLLFVFIGIVAVILSLAFFFFLKTNFYKGAAIPLLLIGLLLGIVGFNVYQRSDEDRKRNVYAYDMNPSQLKNKELPRMKTVMRNFIIYRYTELFLLVAGAALFFYFKTNAAKTFWSGLGLALAIMALLALAADYFAEKRGKVYTDGLASFVK
jgi:uncharacterized membrane protein YbhN (UPF0104 family)